MKNKLTLAQKIKINLLKNYKDFLLFLIAFFTCIILITIATRGFNPSKVPYNENFLSFKSITVKWYAVFILTGIIFAVIFGIREVKKLGLDKDKITTAILIIIPLSIITSRLYYVIFDPDKSNYKTFLSVIDLTKGGLSIHGAFIGAVIFAFAFWKWFKKDTFKILDLIVVGFLIGQIFGRWGNFINKEAHGDYIENGNSTIKALLAPFIWAQLGADGIGHFHPTFLYEMTFNFILLIAFLIYRRMRIFRIGDMFCFYLIYYAILRGFIIEPLRTDQLKIGSVAVNTYPQFMVYSLISSLFFIIRRIRAGKNDEKIPFYADLAICDLACYKENGVNTVLFDLDGTILDTEYIIKTSYKKVFQENFPEIKITEDEYNSFLGPTLYETFLKYTKDEALIEKLIKQYREVCNTLHTKENVKPFFFAKTLLYSLKAKGYMLGIVSSKKHSMVCEGLKLMGVYEIFDIVVSQETTDENKPSAKPILHALKELKIKPDKAIYIGDTNTDIISARNAKVRSVVVGYSKNLDKALSENPNYVCLKLYEILKVVGAINCEI